MRVRMVFNGMLNFYGATERIVLGRTRAEQFRGMDGGVSKVAKDETTARQVVTGIIDTRHS